LILRFCYKQVNILYVVIGIFFFENFQENPNNFSMQGLKSLRLLTGLYNLAIDRSGWQALSIAVQLKPGWR
jgi:hypothetical protein